MAPGKITSGNMEQRGAMDVPEETVVPRPRATRIPLRLCWRPLTRKTDAVSQGERPEARDESETSGPAGCRSLSRDRHPSWCGQLANYDHGTSTVLGQARRFARGLANTIFPSDDCEQILRLGRRVLCYNSERQSKDTSAARPISRACDG